MKTLCIIDVQEYFMAPRYTWYNRVVSGLQQLIHKQIKAKAPILVVEFNDPIYGKTIPPILDVLGDYKYHTVLKDDRSGGAEIEEVVRKNAYPRHTLIAGVNYHQCVVATVNSLLRMNFTVEVYKNVSNVEFCRYESYQWQSIKDNPQLKFRYLKKKKLEQSC